ncbi:MAG: hypothetical protein FWC40_04805 [Proteobacteria bacterium]|nr:hypothetical protein [Pseudomonadota bacterium]
MNRMACGAVMALLFALFTPQAFAQSAETGFELRAGLTVPIVVTSSAVVWSVGIDDVGSIDLAIPTAVGAGVGFGLNLSFGYRWPYFGVYLDQDISSVLIGRINLFRDSESGKKDLSARFLGGSYILFRGFLPVTSSFALSAGLGAGVMYGTNKDFGLFMSDESGNDVAFAFKAQLGFTYYFNHVFGLGFHVDYAMAYKSFTMFHITHQVEPIEAEIEVKSKIKHYVHNVQPTLHFNFSF